MDKVTAEAARFEEVREDICLQVFEGLGVKDGLASGSWFNGIVGNRTRNNTKEIRDNSPSLADPQNHL